MPQQLTVFLVQWGPLIFLFFILYFLILRPQKIQQKKRKEMLDALKRNDRIITAGGIRGIITNVKDEYVTVKIADKVEIELLRESVGRVEGKEGK